MDAYDWDKTVFAKDTTAAFFQFCLRRYPGKLLKYLPVSLPIALRHLRKLRPKPEQKQRYYRYYAELPDIEQLVAEFWAENESLVGPPAMPTNPQPGDVIISASAEFLLRDICARRGYILISSKIDPATGDMLTPDCFDDEKVRRFREVFGENAAPDTWYSDSITDTPMARIAGRAFMVKDGALVPWPEV